MRQAIRIAILGALVAALLPASASAELRWSKPDTLMAGGFPGSVHIDARGDVLAVWHRIVEGKVRTYYAWRSPRGSWTQAREIDATSSWNNVAVVLTPRGRATAAFRDAEGNVLVADSPPGGTFDAPVVVARTGAPGSGVQLATDDAGNTILAFGGGPALRPGEGGSSVFVAIRRPDGSFGEPEELKGGAVGGGPFVAVNAAGAAAVAWMTSENGVPQVAYRQPAGSFGPAERPSLAGPTFPFQLAVDDSGRVHVASPTQFHVQPVRSVLASRSPLGGWSEPHEFETGGPPSKMLVEPDGTVNLLMDDHGDREHPRVEMATRRPDGTVIGPLPVALERAGSDAAMNLRGDILATWEPQFDTQGPVEGAIKRAGSPAFGLTERLSVSDHAVDPHVAINDAGQAAVMFATGGYSNPSLQVAVREDPADPVLPFPPVVTIDIPSLPPLDGDGDLLVEVRCGGGCKAAASGVLVPGAKEKTLAGSGASRRIGSARRGTLTLDFGRSGAKAVRRALARGAKPRVHLSVRARGKSPRPMTVSKRVRVR
jgi:hypothetical protein